MKTKEEILEGREEFQIENYAGRGNHLTIFSKGTVLDAMENYTKQEAIAFGNFINDKDYQPSKWNDKKWVDASFGVIKYTTEELYSLYLQSKEKKLNK